MTLKPNMTGLCDPLFNTLAADYFADEPHYQYIPVSPQSFQIPPLSPCESLSSFFLEIPQDQPFPGVLHDVLYPLYSPHETPSPQPQTVATPPNDTFYTVSHNEATGPEPWFTHLPSSVLPLPSVLVPSSPPTTDFPHNWIKIPQSVYDRGGRQCSKRSEPIYFSTNGRPGINLRDALQGKYTGLYGRDDPMLQGSAGAISCRLLFSGYPDNGKSCQIHALNWTKTRLPITRSKLAHEVAKKLDQYLNNMATVTPDESIKDCWRIGQGFMHIDNMFLVKLVPVSKGSFQPEIWVAGPSVPYV